MEPNFPNLERDLCLAIHELKVKPACAIRLTGVAFIAYVWGRRTEWNVYTLQQFTVVFNFRQRLLFKDSFLSAMQGY